MEFKINLKDIVIVLLVAAVFVYAAVQISTLKAEIKYSQNFTAIVNQVNQNTADIKAIAQAVQVVQQKAGIAPPAAK